MEPVERELRFKDSNGTYHHATPDRNEWHWVAGQPNVEIYERGEWCLGWDE